MWPWLINNLETIKDILWIVFTFAATVVAILTYRRARFTLLQPLHTEVIKRQTDLLVELLDFLYDDGVNFYFKIDYMGIVACNSYLLLKEYGFILKDDEIGKIVDENKGGMLILKESGTLSSIKLPSVFEKKPDEQSVQNEITAHSKEKYEKAQSGFADIECLYLTKQFSDCMKTLDHFIDNPFIPSSIQQLLVELRNDIFYNLKVIMKTTLEQFIIQLCNIGSKASENDPLPIQHQAIYNSFQRKSRHHQPKIDRIRKITREYLMIDKKWN